MAVRYPMRNLQPIGQDIVVQFEKIVDSWRALWNDKSLWFLQVQLTSFETNANWPEARKGQFDAAKSIKNCGIVNIIDLGDKKDIHPLNKKDVGKRLANLALRKVYKKKAPNFNTSYASCKFDGSMATLKLDRECSNEKVSLGSGIRGGESFDGDYFFGGRKHGTADGYSDPAAARPFDSLKASRKATESKGKIVQEFENGDMLRHPKFGVGMLIEQDEKTMTVMFDEVGQKKLGKGFVKMEKL